MKSHKEPVKYILFDKIEIITCYVLIYPLYLHMLNVKLLNRNIKTFQICQTTASIHSSYENA